MLLKLPIFKPLKSDIEAFVKNNVPICFFMCFFQPYLLESTDFIVYIVHII